MNMTTFRLSYLALPLVFCMPSCSDKSDFSEKYRGEDPFFVSDPGADDPDSEVTDPSRIKVDRFEQVSKTNLDVLWIIDNSASMAPYQNMLAANIDAFLQSASEWDANVQMGITSTDMCEAVRPSDPEKIMCPDKSQTTPGLRGKLTFGKVIRGLDDGARAEFAKLARLGTTGSSFEHGLSAAKAAISMSLAGQNNGLVREKSFLSVVIVSDEQDDGVGLSRPNEAGKNWWAEGATRYKFTADDLVSYLRDVRPDGRFSVSSVVGLNRLTATEGPCGTNGTWEAGTEQLRASQLSGGFTLDICSSDWSAGLQAMAENFETQLSSFKLSSQPLDISSIVVAVDGIKLESGWKFFESRQAIVFDVEHMPAFGAKIEISYR